MIADNKEVLVSQAQVVGGINSVPPRMIRVIAPNQLPPYYQLEVKTKDGYVFTATAPADGAKAGEIFVTPEPEGFQSEPLIEIPRGRWRDGLCDAFNYGCCHASLCCSFFCRQIHMGQVMQRMRLNWLGHRTTGLISAFRTVLILTACYSLINLNLNSYISTQEEGYYGPVNIAMDVVGVVFSAYSLYSLCQTRKRVREEFSIPEQNCVGCEDVMCAAFCACCTVAQMARHTGDYTRNPASCCTATGLPNHVPMAAPEVV